MATPYALDEKYLEHAVFTQLTQYAEFYKHLSDSIMSWMSLGTRSITNLDTYVYSSIQGTLESIRDVLLKGRINDAYALVRKYSDVTIINVYTNLFLEDHFSFENTIVDQINGWLQGTRKIPSYGEMSQYIELSPKLDAITTLLKTDEAYKNIRKRCNDHMHYNYYQNLILNDNDVHLEYRLSVVDNFAIDLEAVFIKHFAYIFYLNDHYFMSSDYRDALDCGATSEEEWKYLVAPFIQEIFDKVIKLKRKDIAIEIKNKTQMQLS